MNTTFIAWVLKASLLVTDANGHHPLKPIAADGAAAIGKKCDGDDNCGALYLYMAFRESGYRLDAVGDGGSSFGPFQTKTKPKTWDDAVETWSKVFEKSKSYVGKSYGGGVCTEPLELLATGRCGTIIGKDISRARELGARKIVALMPFKAVASEDAAVTKPPS